MKKITFDNSIYELIKKYSDQIYYSCKLNEKNIPINYESFFSKYMFFMTVSYNPGCNKNIKSCFNAFRGIYINLCREIIGNSWDRKKVLQPFAYYSIDDQGSKTRNHDLKNPINLHIHSIIIVHPEVLDNWKNCDFEKIANLDPRIQDIDVTRYDPLKGSPLNLISYVGKANKPAFDEDINWNFFPESTKKTSNKFRKKRMY